MVMQFKYISSTNKFTNEFLMVNLNTREFVYYTYDDYCKNQLVSQLTYKLINDDNNTEGEIDGKPVVFNQLQDYDLKYRPSMAQMVKQFRNDPTFAELKY